MRTTSLITAFLGAILFAFLVRSTSASAGGSRATSVTTERATALLCGRVLDASESPLANALVIAFPADRLLPIASATTSEHGAFRFSDLPPGRYVLIAIHGHHSPGRSGPVVVGQLGSPFPIKVMVGDPSLTI